MRLFIVAQADLQVPKFNVIATIKDILTSCAHTQDTQVVLVGDHFDEDFIQYCSQFESVSIKSTQAAGTFIKQITNGVVLHFGTNINWAKSFPNYFLPLVLPGQVLNTSFIKKYFIERKFKQWLEKCNKVITTNDWSLLSFEVAYPSFVKKVQLVNLPTFQAPNFEWQQLSAAKADLTNGNNYFLAFAPIERFTAILKEFSIFKKWQQTTMHLVFVFETQQQVDAANVLLKGYKFRQDISIYVADSVKLEWLAATYAILWEGIHFSKSIWIDYAIQYDVPLLFDKNINLPETWLKAGEVFSFSDKQTLSNHFKLYYKDEVYRQARARMAKEWLEHRIQQSNDLELFNKIVLSFN